MNLSDTAKKFEQLVDGANKSLRFDFAGSLALAEKFEQKFIKQAQDAAKNHLVSVLTKAYRTLMTPGSDQASIDFASKTLYPVIESMPGASDESAAAQAQKMYQYLVRNKKTSAVAEELFAAIENLQNSANPYANVPPPPPAEQEVAQKTPAAKWPSINPDIQRKLNKLLGINLVPDGKLGPLTSSALQKAKGKLNLPENLAVNEVAEAVSRMA
jgi:hypothetical protein